MKKTYLLTPGPTPIPETISAVLSQPIIHHRTPAFEKLFESVRKDLQYLYQTKQDVLMLAATGTGAMEAAVSNLFKRGDKVITVNGGKFGERWTKISQVYGLKPVEIKLPSGSAVTAKQVEDAFKANPDAVAVLFQASETSTGVRMPTQEICKVAAQFNALSVCDAITACGVFELPMDAWGIDVLITGSQKALMLPPGLCMIALSEKAWKKSEAADLPKFYFDLGKERKSQIKNQTAWTPAISLIQGLEVSLRMIREEGLENVFKRHEHLAKATRAGIKALGLELLAKDSPSNAVTAVLMPSTISDGKKVPKLMRDKHGVVIVGGQDELEGKIVRLSHFGYCGPFDIVIVISALEMVLKELGHPVELGRAVGAVLNTLYEGQEKV